MTSQDQFARIVITGAPGTGKTTLITALKNFGCHTVDEPARAVLKHSRESDSRPIGDHEPTRFIHAMQVHAVEKFNSTNELKGPVFFDRGLPDLLAYESCFGLSGVVSSHLMFTTKYHSTVFLCPCWEEIYLNDELRQMPFSECRKFEDDLYTAYANLGYEVSTLPKVTVDERMNLVLNYGRSLGETR